MVVFGIACVPFLFLWNYKWIHELSTRDISEEAFFFKFRSLLWGSVITCSYFTVRLYIIILIHLHEFGFKWQSQNQYVYVIITAGLIFSPLISVVVSWILIKIADNGTQDGAPYSYLVMIPCNNVFSRCTRIIFNFFGILSIMLTVLVSVPYICAVFLTVFIEPVEVLSKLLVDVVILMFIMCSVAGFFEVIDRLVTENNGSTWKIAVFLLLLVVVVFVVTLSQYTYSQLVLSTGKYQNSILFSAAEFAPILLAYIIYLFFKHELMAYIRL